MVNFKWIRNTGRALAILWAGLWLLFGMLSGVGEGLDPVGIFMHTAVPGLIFLAAALIAWRWELAGGILLFIEGLATLSIFGFARTPEGFLLLVLPPFVAGGLFLADWLRSNKDVGRSQAHSG